MEERMSTVTFMNNRNFSTSEIETMVSKFGKVLSFRQFGNRIFVQYETPAEAGSAKRSLKEFFKTSYPRLKCSDGQESIKDRVHGYSNPTSNKENDEFLNRTITSDDSVKKSTLRRSISKDSAQLKTTEAVKNTSQYLKDSGNTSSLKTFLDSHSSSFATLGSTENEISKAESIRSCKTGCGSDRSALDYLPPLVDVKQIPKVRCIVLGNIPDQYTLNDVYSLVEEVQPAAFTQIDYTNGKKLKFCEIYVKGEEDISYLIQKLNGFVICGKKLIAVEPSQLLCQPKWDM